MGGYRRAGRLLVGAAFVSLFGACAASSTPIPSVTNGTLTAGQPHIFWANNGGDSIGAANLDGTSVNQNFITGLTTPCGVAIIGTHIYWGTNGPSQATTIGRANLDGTGVNQSFISGATPPVA